MGLSSIVYCNECKFEFSMNAVNIQKSIINIKGVNLLLAYFACPKCNKIYLISIEDEKCVALKEDLERTRNRIRKCGSKNEEMARMLNSMMMKKNKRLKNHLENLRNKYSGTFTFTASENNHKEYIIKYLP